MYKPPCGSLFFGSLGPGLFLIFKKDFIYLSMRDRERERETHRQREKQAPCRLDPRTPGSRLGLQAGARFKCGVDTLMKKPDVLHRGGEAVSAAVPSSYCCRPLPCCQLCSGALAAKRRREGGTEGNGRPEPATRRGQSTGGGPEFPLKKGPWNIWGQAADAQVCTDGNSTGKGGAWEH